MILDFENLYTKYKMQIKGVIHVGAHFGEEFEMYQKYNIPNIVMVEPQPREFEILRHVCGDKAILFNKALGSTPGKSEMYIALGAGSSSSLLKPKLHVTQHPDIVFSDRTIRVDVVRLDDLPIQKSLYNFINIDVQGFELEVFKGGKETLNNIDYIIAEVNRDELYENCAHVDELDSFLSEFNFKRVETDWAGVTWGDAFYIKSSNLNL